MDEERQQLKDVKNLLTIFTERLANISKHYSIIVSPKDNTSGNREFEWLTKIHNTGNITNFLPLVMAARIHYENKKLQKMNI